MSRAHLPLLQGTAASPDIPSQVKEKIVELGQDVFRTCSDAYPRFPADWPREAKLIGLVRQILTVCDRLVQAHIDSLRIIPDSRFEPPACKQGCAWCCSFQVGVSSSELGSIFLYVRKHFSAEARKALWERVLATSRKTDEIFGTQSQSGYQGRFRVGVKRLRDADAPRKRAAAQLPCPFLVSNECSIYPVRPLLCRGYTSQDAEGCKPNRAMMVQNSWIYAIGQGLLSGLVAFEQTIGECSPVELTEGIRAIFEGMGESAEAG